MVFKPTVKGTQGKPKGNVDAELVLQSAAIEFENYDQAVIVSGDGDYFCLHKYLAKKNNKLLRIIIPNRHAESSLLKKFNYCKTFLYREEKKLKKDR